MTYAITVETPFENVRELGEQFLVPRVDETRVMLPHEEAITEGEWVQFEVLLADRTAAIAGLGRAQMAQDNGEGADPRFRYEIVLDNLQFTQETEGGYRTLLAMRSGEAVEPEASEPVSAAEVVADEPVEPPLVEHVEAVPAEDDMAAVPAGDDVEAIPDGEYAEAMPAGEAVESEEPEPANAVEAVADEAVEPPLVAHVEAVPAGDDVEATPDAAEPALAAVAEVTADAFGDETYAPADAEAFEPGLETPAEYVEPMSAEADAFDEPEPTMAIDVDGAPAQSFETEAGMAPITDDEIQGIAPAPVYALPEAQTPDALPTPHVTDAVLTRAAVEPSWLPMPIPRSEVAVNEGVFSYEGGLPRPASPPRPELDAAWRVTNAPRAGEPFSILGFQDSSAPSMPSSAVSSAPDTESIALDEPTINGTDDASEDFGTAEYADAMPYDDGGVDAVDADGVDALEAEVSTHEYAEPVTDGEVLAAAEAEMVSDAADAEYVEAVTDVGDDEDVMDVGDDVAFADVEPEA